ncbi:hypothetical protein ABZ281_10265 [Streptomyces sp. NPDC006265]|uniref:hypothetical protein n=1 Tax=Streptomyces sp. NPDC006265 TaxID=3156740 RepID=UPI0033A5A249
MGAPCGLLSVQFDSLRIDELLDRGLHRPDDTRAVPLPPYLVALWREHVTNLGPATDGRLFFSGRGRGRILTRTTCHRVRHEVRGLALPPALTSTSLANGRMT